MLDQIIARLLNNPEEANLFIAAQEAIDGINVRSKGDARRFADLLRERPDCFRQPQLVELVWAQVVRNAPHFLYCLRHKV